MSLASIVGKMAPMLGSVLNLVLPGSGVLVSTIAQLFGADPNNEKDIVDKINADPDAAIKLKELELTHKYDLDQMLVADRNSARGMSIETTKSTGHRDWVMEFIAIVMVLGFFGMCFIISFVPLAHTDTNLLYLVIGQFSTGFITVLAFYFGATNQKAVQSNSKEAVLPPPAQTR